MHFPRSRTFWSVSFGHTTIDLFNGSVAVLLAFLSAHLVAMTNTEMGIALSAYQMASALSQPFAGWLADKSGGRWLGAGGVAWTVSLIALALVLAASTHSFVLMLIPLVLAALGSGAFHPVGAMLAAESDRDHVTSNLALFFFMGAFGGGLGPAITGVLLDQAATHNSLFTAALGPTMAGRLIEHGSITPILLMALFAVPGVLLMLLFIPSAHHHRAQAASQPSVPKTALQIAPLLLLVAIITLRGLVNPGLVSFLPALFQAKGWTPSEYGLVTSMYWFGGAIAGVVFGQLADRYGNRLMILLSMLLAAPAVFGLSITNGPVAFALALGVGAFSGGSHSLIVAMTQKLMPVGTGFSSGASLGLIFGMGALGVLVIGAISDHIGLVAAFQIVAVASLITAGLSLLLPADRPQRQSAVLEEAAPA